MHNEYALEGHRIAGVLAFDFMSPYEKYFSIDQSLNDELEALSALSVEKKNESVINKMGLEPPDSRIPDKSFALLLAHEKY